MARGDEVSFACVASSLPCPGIEAGNWFDGPNQCKVWPYRLSRVVRRMHGINMSGSPQYTIDRAVGFCPEQTNAPGLLLLDEAEAKISPQRDKVHTAA
jgi:hypothetical protein